MEITSEDVKKIFDYYVNRLKGRSLKWTFRGDSRWGDRKIGKFIKHFFLPINPMDVIAMMDTTIFRTATEGYLFTTNGIVGKDPLYKVYILEFDKIDRAEIIEETDEYDRVTTSAWVFLKDGSKQQIFDFYLKKDVFVNYINDVVNATPATMKKFEEEGETDGNLF